MHNEERPTRFLIVRAHIRQHPAYRAEVAGVQRLLDSRASWTVLDSVYQQTTSRPVNSTTATSNWHPTAIYSKGSDDYSTACLFLGRSGILSNFLRRFLHIDATTYGRNERMLGATQNANKQNRRYNLFNALMRILMRIAFSRLRLVLTAACTRTLPAIAK